VNGLYDVDPRFASTAIPGFTELMQIFQNYRVDSVKVTATLSNKESYPMIVCSCFTGTNTYATNSFLRRYYGNKFSKQIKALSGVGGLDRCTIVNQVNMADLIGTSAYWGDLQGFLGTPATNPGTLLTWNIGVGGMNGENFGVATPGVDVYLEFEFIVEWSNIKIFSS
jgi:hypothetical protein